MNSSSIKWCRYFLSSQELHVQFSSSHIYRYKNVPRALIDKLIISSSVGRFFRQNIAYNFSYEVINSIESPPEQSQGTALDLFKNSTEGIISYLPPGWNSSINDLLNMTPILVKVVRKRKTKHGDHRIVHTRGFSIITINASDNKYQFVITLLHEIAHAKVSHLYERDFTPHGFEWKNVFQSLLLERLTLFPEDLHAAVSVYASNPLSTTSVSLYKALKKYDSSQNQDCSI